MVKDWRNSESHISPTASEKEVDTAINIIITLYFYATGSCITELESAGHDVEFTQASLKSYDLPPNVGADYGLAAEDRPPR